MHVALHDAVQPVPMLAKPALQQLPLIHDRRELIASNLSGSHLSPGTPDALASWYRAGRRLLVHRLVVAPPYTRSDECSRHY